jgi:D-ribose pyranose/furanose isomerase RbsD
MKQGQLFQTTIDLDEVMNASQHNDNVYQALTQVYTLLSQDISHPQIEGKTLAQQIKDNHDDIKQEIYKTDKEHDSKQIKSIKKKQQKKISK